LKENWISSKASRSSKEEIVLQLRIIGGATYNDKTVILL